MSDSSKQLTNFESAMKNAVRSNGRQRAMCTLSMVFADDNTGAKADCANFQRTFTRLFGSLNVSWEMSGRPNLGTFLEEELEPRLPDNWGQGTEDDILVVHYAGHGKLVRDGPNAKLVLIPNADAKMSRCLGFSTLLDGLTFWSYDRPKLSTLFVLDCCHSGASASRKIEQPIEVVYATKATGVTGSRGMGCALSFSQKFVGALNKIRISKPHKEYVDPIEVIAHLKEHGVAGDAGHTILRGTQRMSLYFRTVDRSAPRPQAVETTKVLLRLHIAEGPESANSKEFLALLRQMAGTVAQIDVLSVDRSRSIVVLVRCAAIWGLRIMQPEFRDRVSFLGWSFEDLLAGSGTAFEPSDLSTDPSSEIVTSSDANDGGTPPTSPLESSVKSEYSEERD